MRLRGHPVRGRLAVLPALGLLLVACGSGSSCATTPVPASCPDLLLRGHAYVAWHEIPRPAFLQEVGDATYPACNLSDQCGGDPFGGHESTDVWRLEGVPRGQAVIGYLENTSDTYVVYVRRGVDPSSLPTP
jgi:hypothetical protein